MPYTIVRYRGTPDIVIDRVATETPRTAAELVRRWSHYDADEGVLLAVGEAVVLHCPPKHG